MSDTDSSTCCSIRDEELGYYYKCRAAFENSDKENNIEMIANLNKIIKSIKVFHQSPLYTAIYKQNLGLTKRLLKIVSLSDMDFSATQCFELLLDKDNREVLTLVLDDFIRRKINPIDGYGISPFHIACYLGDVHLMEEFLKMGNYVNLCVHSSDCHFSGYSPLHFAVQSENPNAVDLLLTKYKCDVTKKNGRGKTAFYLACECPNEPVLDLLLQFHFTINKNTVSDNGFSVIHEKLFYKHMIHFNVIRYVKFASPWTSWTPLHYAVVMQKPHLVEFLVNLDVDINAKDEEGMTPLHLACQYNAEMFSKLTSSKSHSQAEINYWILNQNEQVKIAEILLKKGCNVNTKDKLGKTPFFHALENFAKIYPFKIDEFVRRNLIHKRKKLIELLLSFGADVRIADEEGITLLYDLACGDQVFHEQDKVEVAKALLIRGADVNAIASDHGTPLYLAIRNQFLSLAEIFVEHGADVNIRCSSQKNFSPLHSLIYHSAYSEASVRLLNMLLEHGADVHAKELGHATALHLVIDAHGIQNELAMHTDDMALALIQHGADVHAKDQYGQTALHRACLNRYLCGTQLLLEAGADINETDEYGNTPLDSACYRIQRDQRNGFVVCIRLHIAKLVLLGRRVSKRNQDRLAELMKMYSYRFPLPPIDAQVDACLDEIQRMKAVRVNVYSSLYDVARLESDDDLVKHSKNEEFCRLVESETFLADYRHYGSLLRVQLSKGRARAKLYSAAEDGLRSCWQRPDGGSLPEMCIEKILHYLSIEDLKRLSQSL
ncbi:hypothetical protein TKK_0018505 [Trichogramma kaykai]|uniref:Uncharacterized protein n=1 Tax=Trichogramma kaykai TaxID=54128 RepID=A0ABD2VZI1_9HYME